MQGNYKSFWLSDAMFDECLEVIDQRQLPFVYDTRYLTNTEEVVNAIKNRTVCGAGVVGVVAAFGVYMAAIEVDGDYEALGEKTVLLREACLITRNLAWAVDVMMERLKESQDVIEDARAFAIELSDNEALESQKIAEVGCELIEEMRKKSGKEKINILTHASGGYLAFVDDGAAFAPIYEAKRRGVDVHVWVDETRPRGEGTSLGSWELAQNEIDHTIITDTAAGCLMQRGDVDMVIVSADRVSENGDVVAKVGTYLLALAANDNNIPFYVAFPTSTFDAMTNEVRIEERNGDEVKFVKGVDADGVVRRVRITLDGSAAVSFGFDTTPARLITGLITNRGVCEANYNEIKAKFRG
ncbi:MAG: S-methyl-5-thioribose-1-phosphate isomerase [Sulfurimonas sp.]|nr:S-methyl-5-thioribose-1-phosphate isomerase [Sulfurimonas sp.]